MQLVMGQINGVWLVNLMNDAVPCCKRITAAVAYATDTNPFFEHCIDNGLPVEFFGLLDDDGAVALPVLKRLLKAGPLKVQAHLIKGHFHSKVIWWHGYGVYIGSANLTSAAWYSNVETGIFFRESEVLGSLQADLEAQFSYLRKHSTPLTDELYKTLSSLEQKKTQFYRVKKQLQSDFEIATKGIFQHHGLAMAKAAGDKNGYTTFATEWNKTLQLLRGLCDEFHKLDQRPSWVDTTAEPAVHFDQFLHAYYYVKIRDDRDEEDSGRTKDLVASAFERSKNDKKGALASAAEWWASLPNAPYGEDIFIRETAPGMRIQMSEAKLGTWTLGDFQDVFYNVNAFKMHARQVKNEVYGLSPDHKESMRERSDRLAERIWKAKRMPGQRNVSELLVFLFWGTSPSDMAERLWLVTNNPNWRYERLGPSSLGEAVGWARPDKYPPRNNRTNKALRALGHDVPLFDD